MSKKPLEHDHRYGELDQVIRAYLGQSADDGPEQRSAALDAYLRHTWHTRPWAVAVAEQQLREYSRNPPGRLRQRLGEFYPVPDVGLPDAEIQGWLLQLADHLRHSVEAGEVPPTATPGPTGSGTPASPSWVSSWAAGSRRTCRTSSRTTRQRSTTTSQAPIPC